MVQQSNSRRVSCASTTVLAFFARFLQIILVRADAVAPFWSLCWLPIARWTPSECLWHSWSGRLRICGRSHGGCLFFLVLRGRPFLSAEAHFIAREFLCALIMCEAPSNVVLNPCCSRLKRSAVFRKLFDFSYRQITLIRIAGDNRQYACFSPIIMQSRKHLFANNPYRGYWDQK